MIRNTVFSVPTSGQPAWNTLASFDEPLGFGLAISSSGYVFGVTQDTSPKTSVIY